MIESILTDFNHDKKVFTAVEVERHFLTFSQKTKLQANVIDGSSIFVSSLRAGEELIPIYICVLKMSVHPDGASTTVLVTLPVKNVRHGPMQV